MAHDDKKKSLLICEDDRELAEMVISLLPRDSLDIRMAASREASLGALRRKFFHVVVVDLNLEGNVNPDWRHSGGTDILRLLQAQQYGSSAIVLSGSPETELAFELGRDYGAADYVSKGTEKGMRDFVRIVQDRAAQSRIRYPEDITTLFSGLRDGRARSEWMSNILFQLDIGGGTQSLMKALMSVARELFPFVMESRSSCLALDREARCLRARIWSLKIECGVSLVMFSRNSRVEVDRAVARVVSDGPLTIAYELDPQANREEFEDHAS